MEGFKDYIFTWSNPIIYIVFFNILLFLIVFVVFKYVFLPYQRRTITERLKLVEEKKELLSLLADLDPDPILRVNDHGAITLVNQVASRIFNLKGEEKKPFSDLFPEMSVDWKKHINSNETMRTLQKIGERIYTVDIKGIKNQNIVQIYMHDITERFEYEKEVEAYKDRLRILSEYLDTEKEDLKDKVSEFLHDDIAQQLFSIKLLINKNDTAFLDKKVQDTFLSQISSAYQSVRRLSHELKPVRMKEHGIVPALRQLVSSYNKVSKVGGTFTFSSEEIQVSNRVKSCIFRVAHEAIINTIKHAKASEYYIHLKQSRDSINLFISDNGIGMKDVDIEQSNYFNTGIGLFNMKERVEYLQGKITIETSLNQGFTIFVTIPRL